MIEVAGTPGFCIFCLEPKSSPRPWVPSNPGLGCTYGLGHEYPAEETKPAQVHKPDKKLCLKCGLHPRNPKAAANGCEHEYP
jgi:hypothetical protein